MVVVCRAGTCSAAGDLNDEVLGQDDSDYPVRLWSPRVAGRLIINKEDINRVFEGNLALVASDCFVVALEYTLLH